MPLATIASVPVSVASFRVVGAAAVMPSERTIPWLKTTTLVAAPEALGGKHGREAAAPYGVIGRAPSAKAAAPCGVRG